MKRATANMWLGITAIASTCMMASGCELFADALNEPQVAVDSDPMPAISGGTLTVTRDGQYAIAADSEVDKVYVVDLATRKLIHEVQLAGGSEPGRVEQGSDERVHVVLRGSGQLASLSLTDGTVTLRYVCPEPRGVGYAPLSGRVHVACVSGELVTFADDPAANLPLAYRQLPRDLRDVVVHEDKLYLSRFRSAEMLVVDESGAISKRFEPNNYDLTSAGLSGNFSGGVAWRARAAGNGLLAVVHQAALSDELPTGPPSTASAQYYGAGACTPSVVTAATTIYDMRADISLTLPGQGNLSSPVLPVDIAVSDDQRIAVVAAGSDMVLLTSMGSAISSNTTPCALGANNNLTISAPIAAAFDAAGRLIVQSRTEGLLFIEKDVGVVATLELPKKARANTGHQLFHNRANAASSQIACASCHPEGRDDGHVWNFEGIGPRRTQSMLGGVLHSMPLHWDGDMRSLDDLVAEVFVNRMSGPELASAEVNVLGSWMNNLPALKTSAPLDPLAAERGRQLFNDPVVGCANCHSGSLFTDHRSMNVGTGKAFQVPSLLGVSLRTPLMHDGCAETLADRFGPCGGGDAHGQTSHLSGYQLGDLISYLETL